MGFYQPLQRKDGRWDYTLTNSAGTFPVGYCGFAGQKPFYSLEWDELTDIVKGIYENDPARWDAEKAKRADRIGNWHNTGHATPEEAVACFRRYEVLEHVHRHIDEKSQEHCGICGCWTQARVMVGSSISRDYALCPDCDSVENILKLHMKGICQ